MEQNDSRNLILAMVLSMAVLLGWYTFFAPEPVEQPVSESAGAEQVLPEELAMVSRDEALTQSERVNIDTDRFGGSISLAGAVIDDLTLHDYKVELDSTEDVKMLQPKGSTSAYYFQTGFTPTVGTEKENAPSFGDIWSLKSGDVLGVNKPVVLEWVSPTGIVYEREFSVDQNFMFTVTERIVNNSDSAIGLTPLAVVQLNGTPESNGAFVLHEGAVRNVDGDKFEDSFKDLRSASPSAENPNIHIQTEAVNSDGWIGITTKYWMTVLIPQAGTMTQQVMRFNETNDSYNLGAYMKPIEVAAGASETSVINVFAGAKEVDVIRAYEDNLNINRFEDSVDWGWFYFLTKPFFTVLHWLYSVIGNMGLAIIAFTFLVKAVLFPLAYRSYVSMSKMKKLQPQMEKLKEAAGDDRAKLQQGMMELYRREKVNPVSGCLPILLQIPIFFSLYKVLYVTTELRHAPFFGPWRDLSAPDPTSIMNLFGLLPWGAPAGGSLLALVFLGILPLLLGVSMWMTQKLNPTPQDETQKMIFNWMPWVFMFMMGGFASGLLVYWITNNILTFVQQYTIMRSQGVEVDFFGNAFGRKKAD